MRHIHLSCCILLLAAAQPAAAQGRIAIGATVAGELTASDRTGPDGAHYDDWTFEAGLGERYRATLRSDDFDAYLRMGPRGRDGCAPCERNDDGAGGSDARVEMVARVHGPHVIRVTSYGGGQTGRYTLHLEQYDPGARLSERAEWTVTLPDTTDYGVDTATGPAEVSAPPVPLAQHAGEPRYLTARVPEEGRLDDRSATTEDGAFHDVWLYPGRRGETVTFALASDDFDTVLRVRGPAGDGGWRELASDDDGGAGTNSQLTVTLPDQANYEIHAGAYRPGAAGRYTLAATTRAAGEDPTPPARVISPGRVEASLLTRFHPAGENGAPMEAWVFRGLAGWEVVIDMRSDEFDTVLRVLEERAGGPPVEVARDDDGGDGTDSRVVMTLPRTGAYRVHAGAYGRDAEGSYTLALRAPEEAAPPPVSARPQRPGRHTDAPAPSYGTLTVAADTVQGPAEPVGAGPRVTGELHPTDRQALRGRAYFDVWSYRARAGETVRVRMGSDAFDTDVRVGRWVDGAWEELARDDDGGPGTDSELTLRFPADGVYEIHAHAHRANAVGPYWLQVERQ